MELKQALIYTGVAILIAVAVYLGGLFSLIDFTAGSPHFRQEITCDSLSAFAFGDYIIRYETQTVDANLIRPDDNYETMCIPKFVEFKNNDVLIFQYQHPQGVTIDNLAQDGFYAELDNTQTLDNGQLYTFPNDYVESIDVHSNDELIHWDLDNEGWTSSRYTTGSEMYFRFNTFYLNITMDVLSNAKEIVDNNQWRIQINNNNDLPISFKEVCFNYVADGVFGTQTKNLCENGDFRVNQNSQEIFVFDSASVSGGIVDYRAKIIIDNLYTPITIYTRGVLSSDLDRYYSSTDGVIIGAFETEWIEVNELEVYIERVDELEGNIQAQIAYISQLNLTTQQLSIMIDELDYTIQEQTELIQRLELTSNELTVLIDELEFTIDEQIVLIEDLNLEIEEQANLINQLNFNLEQKIQLVNQLTATNEEQAQLIAQLQLSFSEQSDIIDSLENTVEEDAYIIGNLNISLQNQGRIIDELERTSQEKGEIIAELQLTLEEQIEIINELRQSEAEKAETIKAMNDVIEEQGIIIANLRESNEDKELIVDSMYESLDQRNELIESYQQELAKYEAKIQRQNFIIYGLGGLALILIGYIIYRRRR